MQLDFNNECDTDNFFQFAFNYIDKNFGKNFDGIIFDIGSAEGKNIINFANFFSNATIIAVEPIPTSYEILLKNISDNNLKNIIPLNLSITKNGDNEYYYFPSNFSSLATSKIKDFNNEDCEIYWSKSIKINDLFNIYANGKKIIVILDCNGAEHDIINQMFDQSIKIFVKCYENLFLTTLGFTYEKINNLIKERCLDCRKIIKCKNLEK